MRNGVRVPMHDVIPLHGDYASDWAIAERCSGKKADFSRVRLYVMPDTLLRHPKRPLALATAFPDFNAIVFAWPYTTNQKIIVHEFLHLIASPDFHDPEIYQKRCASEVVCWGICMTDTIPSPKRKSR